MVQLLLVTLLVTTQLQIGMTLPYSYSLVDSTIARSLIEFGHSIYNDKLCQCEHNSKILVL